MVGVIDPDQLEEVWLLLFTKSREENFWDSGHILGSILLLH